MNLIQTKTSVLQDFPSSILCSSSVLSTDSTLPHKTVGSYSSWESCVKNSISTSNNNGGSNGRASSELKLYQALIFLGPIFFSFILLILFCFFYRRVNRSSLGTRASSNPVDISTCEFGLKKELRDMLPVIVFRESFFVRDTQCSVCLGEYRAEDRLQQIPACGHTFHMECIDLWLSTHTTCPLCRQSLLMTLPCRSPPRTDESTTFESDETSSVNDGSQPTNEEENPQTTDQQQFPLESDEKSCC